MTSASAYRRPIDGPALAANFRVFAEADCAGEPLYAALSHAIADDEAVLALLLEAPYRQRRPVLLFAVVHDLLLAGTPHPIARFYRSVTEPGAWRTDVERAGPFFAAFCADHRMEVAAMLRERTTQTNEIGRCAGLRLALGRVDASRPIALVDVGCSAGLNLLVDRHRVDYRLPGGSIVASGPSGAIGIGCRIDGAGALDLGPMPAVAARFGIDLAPLDVRNLRDARWLRACVWPSDIERHRRLLNAIELAIDLTASAALDLRAGDATAMVQPLIASIDPGLRPVVFHSWVLSYFDHASRTAFAETMRRMVVERDGLWIAAESAGVVPGLEAPPLADDAPMAIREATLWHCTARGPDGEPSTTCIGRSHPHCAWIEPLD